MEKGFYAEAVSGDEYRLAKKTGFGNRIIYNGPVKSKETVLEAVETGCVVNIDSKRELRWLMEAGRPFRIGVRVNFDMEGKCPGETQCGEEGGRFGFCYENGEFERVIKMISSSNLALSGIHIHCSSRTRSINIYRTIAQMCCEIKEAYFLDLDYVDIGGGFFGGVEGKPTFENYFYEITNILEKSFSRERTILMVEPGICLVGEPIDYVSSVVDVKDTAYNRFVVTDASRTAIDPFFTKNNYKLNVEYTDNNRKVCPRQVICGYTCIENDRLHTMHDACELKEGDRIIYNRAGAYTMCLSPLFIELFPPVYVLDRGMITEIRKRWTVDDYLNGGS